MPGLPSPLVLVFTPLFIVCLGVDDTPSVATTEMRVRCGPTPYDVTCWTTHTVRGIVASIRCSPSSAPTSRETMLPLQ